MKETNLFDINGKPVAYIVEDRDHSIYTWDGHAVCYILNDCVYGWNGAHLGWFFDGVIYDVNGYRVGFTKEKSPCFTKIAPLKSLKYLKNIKNIRRLPFIKPWFKTDVSDMSLLEFLNQGAN